MNGYFLIIISSIVGGVSFVFYVFNSYMAYNYKNKFTNPEKPDKKEVTVVVPVYNEGRKAFEKCIESISKQNTEFIVACDYHKEPYSSITKKYGGNFIFNEKRGSKRAAMATALGSVNTKYVLFVDSDTTLPMNTLESMLSKMSPEIGGVGTSITVRLEDNWISYCSEFFQKAKELVFKTMSFSGYIFVLGGRCALYRTDLIKDFVQSNEFLNDKAFGKRVLISEDTHLTGYVLKHNYKVVIDYDVVVETESQKSMDKMFKQVVRWARGSYIYFFKDIADGSQMKRGLMYSFEMFYTYLIPIAILTLGILRFNFLLNYGVLNIFTNGITGITNYIFIGVKSFGAMRIVSTISIILGAISTVIFLVILSFSMTRKKLKTIVAGGVMSVILLVATLYALFTIWEQEDWLTR
ncbi:MAG: glycosyltransferase [Candidatus Micrarchaeaceae archaeon]|jgi:cellulose synthase/poly-beta-1,6-N-acetylglucosamine synthase-like glycosyltransferase